MSTDDGGLSPFEHNELRDLVLAGTQRIRPATSGRVRVVAAALALLLVGALVGGVSNWAGALFTSPEVMTGLPSPRATAWSGWVAFAAGQGDGDIYLAKEGVAPHRILGSDGDTADQVCPSFSPDGSRLVVGQGSDNGRGGLDAALVIVGLDDDGEPSGTETIPLEGVTENPCAIWSADGRWLAFGAKTAAASVEQVWVVDTRTDDIRRLPGLSATDLEWAPDAPELYIADNGISIYSTATGVTRRLDGTSGAAAFAVSPDGRSLAVQHSDPTGIVAGQPVDLLLMDADGTHQRLLVSGYRVGFGVGPVWSPDGNRVAFQRLCTTFRDASGTDHTCVDEHEAVVVVVNDHDPFGPAGTQKVIAPPRPSLAGQAQPWFPYSASWSPDSQTLLYIGWFSGGTGILAVPVDGVSPPVILERELDVAGHSGEPWNVQGWSRKP